MDGPSFTPSWKEAVLETFESFEELSLDNVCECNMERLKEDGGLEKYTENKAVGEKSGIEKMFGEKTGVYCNGVSDFEDVNGKKSNKNGFKSGFKSRNTKNESGEVPYYPLKTQIQARNFVKKLKKRNITIEMMSEKLGEDVYSFWQWINHCGRPWVGVKMMRMVNGEVESVYGEVGRDEVVEGFTQVQFFNKKDVRMIKRNKKDSVKINGKSVNPSSSSSGKDREEEVKADYLKEQRNHQWLGRTQFQANNNSLKNISPKIENFPNIEATNKHLQNISPKNENFKNNKTRINATPQKENHPSLQNYNNEITNMYNENNINNNNNNEILSNNIPNDSININNLFNTDNNNAFCWQTSNSYMNNNNNNNLNSQSNNLNSNII